jgi:hypothetical protein
MLNRRQDDYRAVNTESQSVHKLPGLGRPGAVDEYNLDQFRSQDKPRFWIGFVSGSSVLGGLS